MLCEFAYCPRLGVMMWAEDLFDDNEYTVEGRTVHHRVDRPAGELPERNSKAPACKTPDDEPDAEEEPAGPQETFHARSVLLSSEKLRLIARLDLVEAQGATVTPVDYKRGAKPDLPEGAWPSDRIQLCAQGLLLREHGYTCTGGVAYYAASKARVPVEFDEALVAETLRQRDAFFDAVAREALPPPLTDSRKCLGCSLVGICLPDEVGLLAFHDQETAVAPDDEVVAPSEGSSATDAQAATDEDGAVRRLWPARDDDVPLIVQNHRARVSKDGERLVVSEGKTRLGEIKLMCTSEVCLYGGV
jgi:CRISPR-associated protein Cas1